MSRDHRRGAVAHVRNIIPRATAQQRAGLHRTPDIATRGLLAVEKLSGPVLDPGCGDGRISEVLKKEAGLRVVSIDLVDHGYGRAGLISCRTGPRHSSSPSS